MDKITDDTSVKTTDIAVVLGLTARRVQQLIQDGTFVTENGRLPLADSVQRYITFLSKTVSPADEEDMKVERIKRGSEAIIKKSKAAIAKLEAEELQSKMHRAEDIEALTEDMIYTIRSALIALPGRLAIDAAAAQTPAEASDAIRQEVHKIMRELSAYHYDPQRYAEKARERRAWTAESEPDDE